MAKMKYKYLLILFLGTLVCSAYCDTNKKVNAQGKSLVEELNIKEQQTPDISRRGSLVGPNADATEATEVDSSTNLDGGKGKSLIEYLNAPQDSESGSFIPGATGDVNLYDYTASKYDRNIMPYELDHLEQIRGRRKAEEWRKNSYIILGAIGIVVLIIFLLQQHHNKVSKEEWLKNIDSNGGIVVRYKSLIDYFMSKPNSKISGFSKEHLSVEIEEEYSITEFTVKPRVDNIVDIVWKLNVKPMGSYILNWAFNETTTDQKQMLDRISADIDKKINNIVIPKFNNEA